MHGNLARSRFIQLALTSLTTWCFSAGVDDELFPTSTQPHRRVKPPCIKPKKTAMTVELMMITLYGIEKSGVGTSSRIREV